MSVDRTGPLEEENAGTGTAMTASPGPDLDPVLRETLDEMDLSPLSDYLQHLEFPRGLANHVLTQVTLFLLLPWHERGGTSLSEPAVIFGSDGDGTQHSTLEPGPGMDDMLMDGQEEAPWNSVITWRPRPPMPVPKAFPKPWPRPKFPPPELALLMALAPAPARPKAPPYPKQWLPKQPPPF